MSVTDYSQLIINIIALQDSNRIRCHFMPSLSRYHRYRNFSHNWTINLYRTY